MNKALISLIGLLLPAVCAVQGQFLCTTNTNDNTITITKYTGPGGAVIIPGAIGGLPVTSIGSNAFFENGAVSSVMITNSVNNIGAAAFAGCADLASVAIPDSVTNMAAQAFMDCISLASVTIPGGVSSIGTAMFAGCMNLTNVTMTSNVDSIGAKAFAGCAGLTGVAIPDSVTNMGTEAFMDCVSLANVTIPGGVSSIGTGAFAGCTMLTNVTMPTNVTSIGTQAFEYCSLLTSVTIPENVTNLGGAAFYHCWSLANITIGSCITNVGAQFGGDPVTDVTMNEGVTNIGGGLFSGCTNLSTITLPASVANIATGAFGSCTNLNAINVSSNNPNYMSTNGVLFDPNGLTLLQYPPGDGSRVYTIPANVNKIAELAFYGCSRLVNVTIPRGVLNIGDGAFAHCIALTAIIVASNNPAYSSIGGVLFDKTQTTLLQCPANVGTGAFSVPKGVTRIGTDAFDFCLSLTNVTIPASVSNIDDLAFQDCKKLTRVYFQGDAPMPGASVFSGDTNVPGAGVPVAYYLPWKSGWGATYALIPTAVWGASVEVLITPAKAVAQGAQWSVDSQPFQNSGATTTDLSEGPHVVSFNSIPGWNSPPSITVMLTNGSTELVIGVYKKGSIERPTLTFTAPKAAQNVTNTGPLAVVMKVTDKKALAGVYCQLNVGAWEPAGIYGSSNTWRWFAQPKPGPNTINACAVDITGVFSTTNKVAFQYNIFPAARGTYDGLFAPTNGPRQQTNSGAITLTVTSTGALSGKLTMGTNATSLAGHFNPEGVATIVTPRKGMKTLTTTLGLDVDNQTVKGTVKDGSFAAPLLANLEVFNSNRPAVSYAGQYTMIIPGTTNPAIGPFGTSYGTVQVSASGGITFAGHLADGTNSVSQNSTVSRDGYWPFYMALYGGNGSIWSWNCFTNGAIIAASNASWINQPYTNNPSWYAAGFTNEAATIMGSAYNATNEPLLALSEGQVVLEGGGVAAITNTFILTSQNTIILTNSADTNGLTLTINTNNGVISGSFLMPIDPILPSPLPVGAVPLPTGGVLLPVGGVLLQNQTNAAGFFPGLNQSGLFLLEAP